MKFRLLFLPYSPVIKFSLSLHPWRPMTYNWILKLQAETLNTNKIYTRTFLPIHFLQSCSFLYSPNNELIFRHYAWCSRINRCPNHIVKLHSNLCTQLNFSRSWLCFPTEEEEGRITHIASSRRNYPTCLIFFDCLGCLVGVWQASGGCTVAVWAVS